MHPILAQPGRLWLYLGAWVPGAGLLAALLALPGQLSWLQGVALALPLSLVYAFICLAAWYPCQTVSAGEGGVLRLVTTHAVASLVSSGLWVAFGLAWARLLAGVPALSGIREGFRQQALLLFVVGILLYSLAVVVSYLLMAFETSREAESRALQAQKEQEIAETQLELARSIQRRLLPPPEMEGEGYRLAARNLPAQFVAGDFYDVFRLGDGTLGIVVADVAGKGMGASLIMASVKAMLPLIAADHTVVETVQALNGKLVEELASREFVALAFARFHPREGHLELANSGLPDPYLLRGADRPRPVEVPGPRLPLGMRTGVAYRSVELTLEPTDRILLLTDGLPEAPTPSGEPLGYEALAELMSHNDRLPGTWLDALLDRIGGVTAESQEDDLTAVLLERL